MYIEVNRFVRVIGVLSIVTASILAIIGFARKEYWVGVLINAFISTIIANVPEVRACTLSTCASQLAMMHFLAPAGPACNCDVHVESCLL